jgi:hypothetical protein
MSVREAAVFAQRPMMGVFRASSCSSKTCRKLLQSVVPDLATSWSWNEDGTELTFPLRQGITWHDGKPLTARMSNAPGLLPAVDRQTSPQSAQGVVPQSRRSHRERRL